MPYLVCLTRSHRLNTTNGGSPTDSMRSVTWACDDDSASGTAHNQADTGSMVKSWLENGSLKTFL